MTDPKILQELKKAADDLAPKLPDDLVQVRELMEIVGLPSPGSHHMIQRLIKARHMTVYHTRVPHGWVGAVTSSDAKILIADYFAAIRRGM